MRIPFWVKISIEDRNSIFATNSAEKIYRRMCCEEKARVQNPNLTFEIDRTIVQNYVHLTTWSEEDCKNLDQRSALG